jgi:HD-GYP domain-containing protein (c-di-GMP phosphodiesterase class II)
MTAGHHPEHLPPALPAGYFPVPVEALDIRTFDMDLYLRHEESHEPALYRAAGTPFTISDARRLAENKVEFVYVPIGQHSQYRRALRERLDRVFHDPAKSRTARARVIRASCSKMIEEVLLFPGRPEAVAMVADISQSFASWSAKDPAGFSYLLDMSAHDFYTITHMVNVGVGCGLLLSRLRNDGGILLADAIQGGLLHDIGKRHVPVEILNKEGSLSPAEWEVLRAHPGAGYEELKRNPAISPTVLEMTRDHHERLDGSGYPAKLVGDQIGLAARLCAVVDAYDAVTASRPYRGPTPPAHALGILGRAAGTHFDAEIFETWRSLVLELVRENPGRAVLTSDAGIDESRPLALVADDRRRAPRTRCQLAAIARLLRKGKTGGPDLYEPFPIGVRDLSRGGLHIQTPFALTIGDLVLIEMPVKGNRPIERTLSIVRVRQDGKGQWSAGGFFIAASGGQAAPLAA